MVSLALTRPCAILWTLLLVLGLTSFQPVGSEREAGRGFAQTKVIGRARWLTDLQGNLLEPILDLRVEAGATDPVVEEVRVEWHIPGTVGGVYPGKIQARRRRTLLGDPNQAWYPDPIVTRRAFVATGTIRVRVTVSAIGPVDWTYEKELPPNDTWYPFDRL